MDLDTLLQSSTVDDILNLKADVAKSANAELSKAESKKQKHLEMKAQSRNQRRKRNKENKRKEKQEAKAGKKEEEPKESTAKRVKRSEIEKDFSLEYSHMDVSGLQDQLQAEISTQFTEIFSKFDNQAEKAVIRGGEDQKPVAKAEESEPKDGADAEETKPEISKKKKKLATQMSLFDLKMSTSRPDLVEKWDITAPDPIFLQEIKQCRNTVPVPKHWSQKRRYLQYKRGLNKQPFKLPSFIEDTGIMKLRARSDDPNKTLKQKLRERIQPKMGKMDIDYAILHDAFFKHQKKEKLLLTSHGEIYFEGKENEVKRKDFKPGRLSPALIAALGIPDNMPPPWIMNMQKHGPPPAYPTLKVPGVNIPIPQSIRGSIDSLEALQNGTGGLFKDERGFTVYADNHGLNQGIYQRRNRKKRYWGELDENEQDPESEEEDEEEDDNELEEDLDEEEMYAPSDIEEEDEFAGFDEDDDDEELDADALLADELLQDYQKQSEQVNLHEEEPSEEPNVDEEQEKKELYHVLPQVKVDSNGANNDLYGSSFTYEMPDKKEETNGTKPPPPNMAPPGMAPPGMAPPSGPPPGPPQKKTKKKNDKDLKF